MDDLEAGAWFVHKFGYLGSTVGLTRLARVARLARLVGSSEQGEEGVEEQELFDSEMALLEANILISSQLVAMAMAIVAIEMYATYATRFFPTSSNGWYVSCYKTCILLSGFGDSAFSQSPDAVAQAWRHMETLRTEILAHPDKIMPAIAQRFHSPSSGLVNLLCGKGLKTLQSSWWDCAEVLLVDLVLMLQNPKAWVLGGPLHSQGRRRRETWDVSSLKNGEKQTDRPYLSLFTTISLRIFQ